MKTKTKAPKKGFHVVFYVQNCSSAMMFFKSKKHMKEFIEDFQDNYPVDKASDTGSWIDCIVTNVHGTVTDLSE